MNFPLFSLARDHMHPLFQVAKQPLRQWTKPGNHALVLNAASDLTRSSGFIEVLQTPYGAPKANAICERFRGSVRRECLDHFLILSERHLYRLMKQYQRYFNHARPHQAIGQRIPFQPLQGASQKWMQNHSLAPYWVVCITTTSGARLRNHHIHLRPDGWEYSARTA